MYTTVLLHVKEKTNEHSISHQRFQTLTPLASLHIIEEFMDEHQVHFDEENLFSLLRINLNVPTIKYFQKYCLL